MATTNTLPARQNTKVLTVKKSVKQKAADFNTEIERAWELYREQLQRNFELMQIITEMQKAMSQSAFINLQPTAPPVPEPDPVKKDEREDFPELQSIPMQHFKKVLRIYMLTNVSTIRTDALQSHLELLYALHQIQEAYPEKLYMHMGIPDSTGYRYVRMLQQAGLVKYSRGKLMLAKCGVLMMNAQLNTANDALQLVEQLKKEGSIPEHQRTSALETWFQNNGQKM